jgi:aliphatic nitrilase
MGGLICGEHTMSLPGFTLAAMGEQVHIAAWIGFGVADISLTEICSRYYAIAYNTFVICTQSVVNQNIIDKLGLQQALKIGNAWSAIIESGTGRVLAGPLPPAEEGILCTEIDLQKAKPHYQVHETTGHYWPKQFRVFFDSEELKPLNIFRQPRGAIRHATQGGQGGVIELPSSTSSTKNEEEKV